MPVAMTVGQYGVVVVDEDGSLLWESVFPNLRVYGLDVDLETGSLYITTYKEIVEITRSHEWTWRYSTQEADDLHSLQLVNGNCLVSASKTDVVLEVNKKEGVVWSWRARDHYQLPRGYTRETEWLHLNHAYRLPNGNTIIGMYYEPTPTLPTDTSIHNGRIVEVDPKGEVQWSFGSGVTYGQHYVIPYKGDYLMADSMRRRLVGFNPKGIKSVMDLSEYQAPLSIDVKPNGNFLVSFPELKSVVEFTPRGKEVWSYTCPPKIRDDPNRRVHVAKYLPFWDLKLTDKEENLINERLKRLGYIAEVPA